MGRALILAAAAILAGAPLAALPCEGCSFHPPPDADDPEAEILPARPAAVAPAPEQAREAVRPVPADGPCGSPGCGGATALPPGGSPREEPPALEAAAGGGAPAPLVARPAAP